MKLEDLPGELWFLILSYLSPIEVFYAFSDVNNKRIRSILTELYSIRKKNGSSLLKISLVDIPLFLYQFAILHVISLYYNEIHSLTLSNEQTPDQIKDFLRKYSFNDFKYLKFLRLIKPSSNEFNIIINDLCNVETLDIQSEDINSFDINTVQKIFYSESSITHCYLSEFQEEFISNNSHSSMKELVINSCDYLCFVNILNHFCSLEKLTINTLLMSSNVILGSNPFKENSILLIKDLKICAHSIPFDYLQQLFRYFGNIQVFSLSIVSSEDFGYVDSDKWQININQNWPLLRKLQFYVEFRHVKGQDFTALCVQLCVFENNECWTDFEIKFISNWFRNGKYFVLVLYSDPYPSEIFYNRWNHRVNAGLSSSSTNGKDMSSIENTYRFVKDLRLMMFNDELIEFQLDKPSHYFSNINTLSIRFEENVATVSFGKYIERTVKLECIKHFTLHDEFHSMATLHQLVPGLLNITKLTITSNHCILIKQLFQPGCEHLLSLLSARLLHFNLLYSGVDGVISCETVQDICYKFRYLKSFSAHFEDFSKSIPLFIHHMKSLQYLHIGLKGDNNEKKICPQDMYECFQRHNISYEFKLHIDTCTNSIHLWL